MAWLWLWASRDFTASAPNVNYVGDITYLPLATGTNLYLATAIDCCSRRLDGRRILRIENLHTTQPQLRIWHQ